MSNLNELGSAIAENAIAHGFKKRGERRDFGSVIALIHSEISEAFEEYRDGRAGNEIYFNCPTHGDVDINVTFAQDLAHCEKCQAICKPEGIPVELADALIRILDLAVEQSANLDIAVAWKMAYNATRPYKHGKVL